MLRVYKYRIYRSWYGVNLIKTGRFAPNVVRTTTGTSMQLAALPTERGKVKPVDCPLVDDRPRILKSNGRKKQEKRGGIGFFEAAKSLVLR